MEANNISNTEAKKELLDAISHAFNHGVSFLNSMALECAVELGISDAIKKHGNPMTLDELVTTLSIHPNKGESLRQLIRLLVHSNFYTTQVLVNGEEAYDLTINSQILLKDHPLSQAPLVALIRLNPLSNEPSSHSISLAKWFRKQDEGTHLYQGIMPNDSKLNESFNQAMASDSRMVGSLLMGSDEFNGLIQGVESLVDVGGGDGTLAKAIAMAYPKLNCIVFDQPHVVNNYLHDNGTIRNLTYVAGDMFQAIPPAHVVLLKWILHNWSDESCIKFLNYAKKRFQAKTKEGSC